jgi:hypothetical protein
MTAKQYRATLARLALTQREAGEMLGLSVRASHGYANGLPIPAPVVKLLRLMTTFEMTPDDVRKA